MSKSNNINIFVKGKKNQFVFSISSPDFEVLYQSQSKLDVGEDISPIKADILAIKEGLNFVKENRGNGIIPSTPIISFLLVMKIIIIFAMVEKMQISFVMSLRL